MESPKFYDFQPKLSSFREEVFRGLSLPQKSIPPKFFYDKRGSELFDRICVLEEYYPTRTETALLRTITSELAAIAGSECLLIEYGSGSSTKIRILLDALHAPAAYMPIDISKEHMLEAAAELASHYPSLTILAVCADYTQPLRLPSSPHQKQVIFFPGSTIGNLEPEDACQLLRQSAGMLNSGDGMLVGVDLKKDPAVLHAAYNDAQEVTAAFNLNLLERINRELEGKFDLSKFVHKAFYNETLGRIEMHLVSLQPQDVAIADTSFSFQAGETIHTENSYKYSLSEFRDLALRAGFTAVQSWTDDRELFSLHYLSLA